MVSVPRLKAKSNRQKSALEEAKMVAAWATATTPEWVRCLGAIWEAFDTEALLVDYRAHVVKMVTTDKKAPPWVANDPKQLLSRRLDDLEVVVRQLRERDYFRAAFAATEVGIEIFPDTSWVFSVAGNCARQAGDLVRGAELDRRCAELLDGTPEAAGAWARYANALGMLTPAPDAALVAFAQAKVKAASGADDAIDGNVLATRLLELKRMAEHEPEQALEAAWPLYASLSAQTLAESDAGHAFVEFLLDRLLEEEDERAVTVAQGLLDAKLTLWGECPAAWIERHNLGTVYAQLGQIPRGRALVVLARESLLTLFAEDHPHVLMCDQTLARMDGRPIQ